MKKRLTIILAVLIFTVACSVPALPLPTSTVPAAEESPTAFPSPEPSVSPTAFLPLPSETVTATSTTMPTNTATPTNINTALPSSTPAPSATPISLNPIFIANIDSNCRSGPSRDYPVLGYILNGEAVQILGKTTPERILWWYVQNKTIRCWVSASLGLTGGSTALVPAIVAPPLPPTPTPTRNLVRVLFENNTGESICELTFYDGVTIVEEFHWNKGDWKGDGSDQYLDLPIGGYDLVEARKCNGNLIASLVDIVINEDNDAYPIP